MCFWIFKKRNEYEKNTKKYIEKKADEFQKPIQYQLLALEEMLKFQKNKMQKELWISYIVAIKKYFIEDLENLFKDLLND